MNLYCVVYRTGGWARFQWRRSVAETRDAALKTLERVERMGYKAHVENYDLSKALGLPETFEASPCADECEGMVAA